MNTLPPHSPPTEADAGPPRPGLANALGVCHLVVASVVSLIMVVSIGWAVVVAASGSADRDTSAMMGLDDPRYLGFILVDGVSGLVLNGFTFASGVGLVNLRAWGARVWRWLAPVKIARLVVVWGGFIVAVAPGMASRMGQAVAKMMQQSASGRRFPTAGELSLVYAWMFLAMAIGMMVLGSIYPAVTWWLVGRPGLRSALKESGADFPAESSSLSPSPSKLEARPS